MQQATVRPTLPYFIIVAFICLIPDKSLCGVWLRVSWLHQKQAIFRVVYCICLVALFDQRNTRNVATASTTVNALR